jgi:hypothetical protein
MLTRSKFVSDGVPLVTSLPTKPKIEAIQFELCFKMSEELYGGDGQGLGDRPQVRPVAALTRLPNRQALDMVFQSLPANVLKDYHVKAAHMKTRGSNPAYRAFVAENTSCGCAEVESAKKEQQQLQEFLASNGLTSPALKLTMQATSSLLVFDFEDVSTQRCVQVCLQVQSNIAKAKIRSFNGSFKHRCCDGNRSLSCPELLKFFPGHFMQELIDLMMLKNPLKRYVDGIFEKMATLPDEGLELMGEGKKSSKAHPTLPLRTVPIAWDEVPQLGCLASGGKDEAGYPEGTEFPWESAMLPHPHSSHTDHSGSSGFVPMRLRTGFSLPDVQCQPILELSPAPELPDYLLGIDDLSTLPLHPDILCQGLCEAQEVMEHSLDQEAFDVLQEKYVFLGKSEISIALISQFNEIRRGFRLELEKLMMGVSMYLNAEDDENIEFSARPHGKDEETTHPQCTVPVMALHELRQRTIALMQIARRQLHEYEMSFIKVDKWIAAYQQMEGINHDLQGMNAGVLHDFNGNLARLFFNAQHNVNSEVLSKTMPICDQNVANFKERFNYFVEKHKLLIKELGETFVDEFTTPERIDQIQLKIEELNQDLKNLLARFTELASIIFIWKEFMDFIAIDIATLATLTDFCKPHAQHMDELNEALKSLQRCLPM